MPSMFLRHMSALAAIAAVVAAPVQADYQLQVPLSAVALTAAEPPATEPPATEPPVAAMALTLTHIADRKYLAEVTGGTAPYAFGIVLVSIDEPGAACSATEPVTPYAVWGQTNFSTCTDPTYGGQGISVALVSDLYDAQYNMIPGPDIQLQLEYTWFAHSYRVVVFDAAGNSASTPVLSAPANTLPEG